MSAQPNHLTVSPAKLEKTNGHIETAGNLAELIATGATTFGVLPVDYRLICHLKRLIRK